MIQVYHFHNGSGGGVLSVIKNLIKFSCDSAINHHIIYTINKDKTAEYFPDISDNIASQQVFYYSRRDNFYNTCNRLSLLVTGLADLIIAHDWLELGMMSNLGLQCPAIQFVHGDFEYYYELASKHISSVEKVIAVSPLIYEKLALMLPGRKADIIYCRFPVPDVARRHRKNAVLKVIFCVNQLTEERKQFSLLPLINKVLKKKNISVSWTIIGAGYSESYVDDIMDFSAGDRYFSSLPNDELMILLGEQDVFLLPSLREGFPVSLVEAMKGGAVPLTTDWNGAVNELIVPGQTGWYVKVGDIEGYVRHIETLHNNRDLLKTISNNAVDKANELFDPVKNTQIIESVFKSALGKKIKFPFKAYGSRLDQPWLPNILTKLLRQKAS